MLFCALLTAFVGLPPFLARDSSSLTGLRVHLQSVTVVLLHWDTITEFNHAVLQKLLGVKETGAGLEILIHNL